MTTPTTLHRGACRHARRGQHGFSITELMLTITIMGIMSAVVVVGALQFGTSSPCGSDARMLRNAEASFFAANSRYGTEAELVTARLIPRTSTLHSLSLTGLSYTIGELGQCVGSGSASADTSNVTLPTAIPGITVLVTNTSGNPVSGVTAEYRSGAGAWQSIGLTNAKGMANKPVSSGTYDVRATLHGVTSTVSGVNVGVGTLVYVSTVPLTATLTSWDGTVEQGVPMSATPSGGSQFSLGNTGPNGVTVDVLPGTYDVSVTYNNVTVTQSNNLVIQATTVPFHSAPLTVKVVTKVGNGIPGVVVTLTPSPGAALPSQVTGSDGTAVFDLLPWLYGGELDYQVQGGNQTHTVTIDPMQTGTDPTVVVLTANR
jgi:prepilin-type N-terminal cleavage/methylation domain-containing protein